MFLNHDSQANHVSKQQYSSKPCFYNLIIAVSRVSKP